MSRMVSIPEEIFRQAEQLAARDHCTVEEVVSAALVEYLAGAEYIRRRGGRASLQRFRAALDCIPDTEPDPQDRVPESRQ
jgi:hypothetical protein